MVDHMLHWIALHECNRIAVFSDRLSSQIPRSHAASAFNVMRDALYRSEIVRLATFWDKAAEERESIPTVIALIDDKAVRKRLAVETYNVHADRGVSVLGQHDIETEKIIREMARQHSAEFARKEARKTITRLCRTISKANTVIASAELKGLLALRNNHFAHTRCRLERPPWTL